MSVAVRNSRQDEEPLRRRKMQFHLELQIAENTAAGMNREEACGKPPCEVSETKHSSS